MNDIIKPNVLLSGQELCEMNKKIETFEILPKGDKLEEPDDEQLEIKKSGNHLQNLHEMLKLERSNCHNRSIGIYEKDNHRVRVIKAVGRWTAFGYTEGQNVFLHPHEALLFMEMNRLEVTFDGVIMSIQQGYAIFLGHHNEISLRWEEYIVYSYLIRAGYYAFLPNAMMDKEKFENSQLRNQDKIEDEMIRCVLNENLNLPFSFDFVTSNYSLYDKTKKEMKNHFNAITNGKGIKDENNDSEIYEPPSKKFKVFNEEQERNFLDILKAESEYLTYQEVFKKFSAISRNESLSSNDKPLKFSFDIHYQKANFKRTENLANFRLLVLSPKDKFPIITQLEKLRKSQPYKVPIIIAIVSQSIQFSICTF